MRMIAALGIMAALATSAQAQPIHVVSAPAEVLNWSETARITKITFEPHDFRVEFDKADSWPEAHVPGWGDPNFSDAQKATCNVPGIDNGCIQFTLWPVILVNGEWFTTGALEFWQHKSNVGGPFSEASINWYDKMPPMAHVQPGPGQRVGFMVVAGDQRLKDVRSVRERSAIAWVTVPANDTGTFTFDKPAPPVPPVVDPPVPPPAPVVDLTAVLLRLDQLERRALDAENRLNQAEREFTLIGDFEVLKAEVEALKSRRIPASCSSSIFGIAVSCKLVF